MSFHFRRRSAGPVQTTLVTLALGLALTGCGTYTGSDDVEGTSGAGEPTTAAPSTASPSPSDLTTASTNPVPTVTDSVAPASGPEGMLLTADEMPGLNERTTWIEESTQEQGLQADGSSPVGACQLTPLHDIGATEAIQRTFTAEEGDATATQVIATLADAKSVRQTHEVLRSWHAKCADTVEAAITEVGPLEEVTVENGKGEAYVVHYGAEGDQAHTWESVAINVSGNLISLVVITSQSQDYNYDTTPAEQAAVAVGARLG